MAAISAAVVPRCRDRGKFYLRKQLGRPIENRNAFHRAGIFTIVTKRLSRRPTQELALRTISEIGKCTASISPHSTRIFGDVLAHRDYAIGTADGRGLGVVGEGLSGPKRKSDNGATQ